MGLFEQFPWTNFDRLNLDALMRKVSDAVLTNKRVEERIETLVPEIIDQAIEDGRITPTPQLLESKNLVFAGDSNWSFGQSAIDEMLRYMPGCSVTNLHVPGSGGTWSTILTQLSGYQGTPDVIFLCAGGNALPGSLESHNLGGLLGAPDTRSHTLADMSISSNQTQFNYMRSVFQYIRDTWPRALVYTVIRSNQPKKDRGLWYYLKFYEQQICQEWGVPVIDANNIMNLTYWNSTQKAIYNMPDEQHFTAEAYLRYMPGVGVLAEANAAVQFSQMPSDFYVPMQAVDSTLDPGDPLNAEKMVRWVAEHCAPMYGNAWSAGGTAHCHVRANVVDECRFSIEVVYNNDYTQRDLRGIIWLPDRQILILDDSTITGDAHAYASNVIQKRTIQSYATPPSLETLADGVYGILNTEAADYNSDGELPTAGGGLLTVASVRALVYSGTPNRIYTYVRASDGALWTGVNQGGAITWYAH